MATSKSWPSQGVVNVTPTSYSIPQAGNVNWASLTDFLVALANGAQSTTFQRFANRTATTSPVTVSTNDCIVCTNLAIAGAVAVTLPAGVDKQVFVISDNKGDAKTNNITITPNGAETIGGAATLVLNTNSESVMLAFQSSTSNWNIVTRGVPNPNGSSVGGFTASRAIVSDGSGNLAVATTTSTEIGYVNGVTSAIQTQLNSKITDPGGSANGDVLVIAGGIPTWDTIANASISAAAAIDVNKLAALTVDRAVVTDGSGFISAATTTSTEIGYVNGVTSAIQTQLDNKQPLDADLTALAALATTGLAARTGAGTWATRTATAGSSKISITNGDGVSGNPTIDAVEAQFTLDNIGGTLAITKGGTGVTSVTTAPTASSFAGWDANSNLSANAFIPGYATTATAAGTTTLTVASKQLQFFTGTSTQTVTLPVTSTLVTGQYFHVVNNSTQNVTVQSSGANTVQVMGPGSYGTFTCILTSGTTAASWNAEYSTSAAGTVTSVALSVPATSIFGVTGSPVTTTGTLGLTTTGTSGGIPYFSSSSQISSSAALTASQLIVGGGAGTTPATLAAGSQYQVLVMGAANPGYGQVNLAQSAAITGTLPVGNGGTGQTTVTYAPGTTAGFISTSGVLGFTNGSSRAAGYVGEVMQATATSQNYSGSGTYTQAGNLTLTAGSWLISFQGYFSAAGAAYSNCGVGVSTNSGTSSAGLTNGDNFQAVGNNNSNGYDMSGCITGYSVNPSSTTNYYGKVVATYTGGSPTFSYRFTAVRIS